MNKFHTNKPDAARRQIDAAIRMLFSDEDVLAVHTVSSAAYGILRGLAGSSGKSKIHQKMEDRIMPGKKKEFWKAANRVATFLKHADQDPAAVLVGVREEINDIVIFISCLYYQSLGFSFTKHMLGFMAWHMAMNPPLVLDSAPEKKFLEGQDCQALRSRPRHSQLEFGKMLLTLVPHRK